MRSTGIDGELRVAAAADARCGDSCRDNRRPPGTAATLPLAGARYYEDTDAAGVVYYASYLRLLERARTEWLAAMGVSVTNLAREHKAVFVVHRLEIDYRAPARLYDALEVTLRPVERANGSGLPESRDLAPDAHSGARTLLALECSA